MRHRNGAVPPEGMGGIEFVVGMRNGQHGPQPLMLSEVMMARAALARKVMDQLDERGAVLISGPSGSGKTCLLRQLYAAQATTQMVVWVSARFSSVLAAQRQIDQSDAHALVIVDALDEWLAREKPEQVWAACDGWMQRGIKLLVSRQSHKGEDFAPPGFLGSPFELPPLSAAEQDEFLRRYVEVISKDAAQTERIVKATRALLLRDPVLRERAGNPLFLYVLIFHQYLQSEDGVPLNREDFYRSFLLNQLGARPGVGMMDQKLILRWERLRKIANQMFLAGEAQLPSSHEVFRGWEDILQELCQCGVIEHRPSEAAYAFQMHRSFLVFLSADYLLGRPQLLGDRMEILVNDHRDPLRMDVLRMAMRMTEDQPTRLRLMDRMARGDMSQQILLVRNFGDMTKVKHHCDRWAPETEFIYALLLGNRYLRNVFTRHIPDMHPAMIPVALDVVDRLDKVQAASPICEYVAPSESEHVRHRLIEHLLRLHHEGADPGLSALLDAIPNHEWFYALIDLIHPNHFREVQRDAYVALTPLVARLGLSELGERVQLRRAQLPAPEHGDNLKSVDDALNALRELPDSENQSIRAIALVLRLATRVSVDERQRISRALLAMKLEYLETDVRHRAAAILGLMLFTEPREFFVGARSPLDVLRITYELRVQLNEALVGFAVPGGLSNHYSLTRDIHRTAAFEFQRRCIQARQKPEAVLDAQLAGLESSFKALVASSAVLNHLRHVGVDFDVYNYEVWLLHFKATLALYQYMDERASQPRPIYAPDWHRPDAYATYRFDDHFLPGADRLDWQVNGRPLVVRRITDFTQLAAPVKHALRSRISKDVYRSISGYPDHAALGDWLPTESNMLLVFEDQPIKQVVGVFGIRYLEVADPQTGKRMHGFWINDIRLAPGVSGGGVFTELILSQISYFVAMQVRDHVGPRQPLYFGATFVNPRTFSFFYQSFGATVARRAQDLTREQTLVLAAFGQHPISPEHPKGYDANMIRRGHYGQIVPHDAEVARRLTGALRERYDELADGDQMVAAGTVSTAYPPFVFQRLLLLEREVMAVLRDVKFGAGQNALQFLRALAQGHLPEFNKGTMGPQAFAVWRQFLREARAAKKRNP